ncbi:SprT-like family-domain-containing protein [Microdochium bolleyi]|uniref:SprT-like family-domain-containing protein n=1 Tax=Microdochium bolleyi TaxID=196109 RepID=A0A136J0W3_9PEZI|nr:SprT-like family-domain-containing protein [Microdochium bolleyi]
MIDSDEEDHKARRPKPTPRVKLRQKISKISLIAEDSTIGDSVMFKDITMRSSDHDSSAALGGPIPESESDVDLCKSDIDSPSRGKNKTIRSLFAPRETEADKSRMSEHSKGDQSSMMKDISHDAEHIENRIKSVRLIEPSPVKPKASTPAPAPTGDLEAAFGKLTLLGSTKPDTPNTENESEGTVDPITADNTKSDTEGAGTVQVAECSTPQRATKNKLLPSPSKPAHIPNTPWQPENKEFWDPEVNFTWIDRHSPERQASPRKLTPTLDDATAMKQKYTSSPQKKSEKKAFDAIKDEIAKNFLQELDERITDGRLESLAATSGGLKTVWSKTLQTTAGRAHWRCKTTTRTTKHKDGSVTKEEERQHEASIELATKVLTNEDDLLNTVAHEFCHLAVFMLDGKPKMAHGKEFKAWGAKCSRVFKDKGITVTTKHSYEIDYKYIWRCAECTCEVHRHTKSVDPQRQRCGRCRGVLVQVKPVPRVKKNSPAATTGGVPEKKKLSAWQEFLSAQMAELKTTHKELAFDKKMEIVSGRWKEHKKKVQEQKEHQDIQQQLDAQFSQDGEQASNDSTTLDGDSTGVDSIVECVQAIDLSVDGDSNVVDSTVLL